jgi:excisionase family DNA binding protein
VITGKPPSVDRRKEGSRPRRGGRRITDLPTHPDAYVKVGAFAQYLDVRGKTVRKWIKAGTLPAYRLNGHWRIAKIDALAFIERARFQS